jgi:hypothetical protein
MAEDSGAFKTNPANSRQIPVFVIIRGRRCSQASPFRKRFPAGRRVPVSLIFSKRRGWLAVFSNQPDSLRAGGVRRVANPANSVATAFP